MNIPDAIEAARHDMEAASGEPCSEATEAIDRLAALGPPSVEVAAALAEWQDLVAVRQMCRKCQERLRVPCDKHMGAEEYERRRQALAAWADAQDGGER